MSLPHCEGAVYPPEFLAFLVAEFLLHHWTFQVLKSLYCDVLVLLSKKNLI